MGAVTHVILLASRPKISVVLCALFCGAATTEGYGIFILLASFAAYAAALRALLRLRSARGAICAHSLTSELADSLRLIIENMLNASNARNELPMAKAS